MPSRKQERSDSTLILVLLLFGRLAGEGGGQESRTTDRHAHRGYERIPTSLCKAVMMPIGILPHTYNFQGIYPCSYFDTGWKASVSAAQVLKQCLQNSPAANSSVWTSITLERPSTAISVLKLQSDGPRRYQT